MIVFGMSFGSFYMVHAQKSTMKPLSSIVKIVQVQAVAPPPWIAAR